VRGAVLRSATVTSMVPAAPELPAMEPTSSGVRQREVPGEVVVVAVEPETDPVVVLAACRLVVDVVGARVVDDELVPLEHALSAAHPRSSETITARRVLHVLHVPRTRAASERAALLTRPRNRLS